MGSVDSPAIEKLVQARKAALENVALYPELMGPIIGLAQPAPNLELRRWLSAFIAEALASPSLDSKAKQKMALHVLSTLKSFLEHPEHDIPTLKSTVQACASLYPLIFRHIIENPNDAESWNTLSTIKTTILRNLDNYSPGLQICCIKFIQCIIQTQTHGVIADPRRPEQNEISLALVPLTHPLIPPSDLEAETSGLLDRILGLLQDTKNDALLITATLNALGGLVKSRASIATKILNTVLRFNPLEYATSPLTTKSKILIRSLERTIRALFLNTYKRNTSHPLAARMQTYLERLHQGRTHLFEEASRKRPASTDPNLLQQNKKPKVEVPSGPVPLSQVFNLGTNPTFNVGSIPQDIVSRLLVPLLQKVDGAKLEIAVNTVKARMQAISQAYADSKSAFSEDEEEYEPDFQMNEDPELKNRMEMESADDLGIGIPKISQISLGPFKLPAAEPLSQSDVHILTTVMMDALFSKLDISTPSERKSGGINRLAADTNDRNAVITTLTRLITRPLAGQPSLGVGDVGNRARHKLLQYILSDWTRRMEIATAWLTEEWYNDQICLKQYQSDGEDKGISPPPQHFPKWTIQLLDELSAFIESEHKNLLIRFMSDVPGLNAQILDKLKHLADDPERVTLVITVIHYLTLFRPPIREICLDALQDLYLNYEGAKQPATAILRKFRSHFIEQQTVQ